MNWISLDQEGQLQEVINESANEPVLIFKHSTRCSISAASLDRLERRWQKDTPIKTYFLDLIRNRTISNEIESTLGVAHQSPQALVIKDGKCIYEASHFGIDSEEIREAASGISA